MKLRPYQQDAVSSVLKGFGEFQRQLLVAPTGAGKTVMLSSIAKPCLDVGKKVLILAHREELIAQASRTLQNAQGIWADMERASHKASPWSNCVVASVQSLVNRLERYKPDHFRLIVIDEAHHTPAATYRKILDYFEQYLLLGVTATPDRSDRKSLAKHYENIAFEIGIRDLIMDGHLCPITVESFPINADLSHISKSGGDYSLADAGEELDPELFAIAREIRARAGNRRTLVFLPLVETSKEMARLLGGLHVDGTSTDRKQVLSRFAKGDAQFLCNAMLLTEGYDDPGIEAICCLRPTKSRSLYQQIIGRGLRTAPGKQDLLVLDPLWLSEEHSLIKPASLLASSKEEAIAMTRIIQDEGKMDLLKAEEKAEQDRLASLKKKLEENRKRASRRYDPVEYAVMLGNVDLAEYQPEMQWEEQPVTPKQAELLKRFGFDPERFSGKGQASKIISSIFARQKLKLATPAQLKWLNKHGIPNAEQLSFEEASHILDREFAKR